MRGFCGQAPQRFMRPIKKIHMATINLAGTCVIRKTFGVNLIKLHFMEFNFLNRPATHWLHNIRKRYIIIILKSSNIHTDYTRFRLSCYF